MQKEEEEKLKKEKEELERRAKELEEYERFVSGPKKKKKKVAKSAVPETPFWKKHLNTFLITFLVVVVMTFLIYKSI